MKLDHSELFFFGLEPAKEPDIAEWRYKMNFDHNELFFFNVTGHTLLPNKLEPAKGQDVEDWLNNEFKKRPAKVICDGQIIGEATYYDEETEAVVVDYYDRPIPAMIRSDRNELAIINGFDQE